MNITFKTKDAELYGATSAMIISAINDMPGEVVKIDDQWWVRARSADINAFLPFLSGATIVKATANLSKKGVIKRKQHLLSTIDHSHWYAIKTPDITKTKWIKSGVTVKV